MTTFILILTLMGQGRAIHTVEFTSKDKCEAAGMAFVKSVDRYFVPNAGFVCVEK